MTPAGAPGLGGLQAALGYHFTDQDLLEQALRHRSLGRAHNERLEFLGDGLLNFVIAEQIYRRRPHAPEGDLSRIRAALVRGTTLTEIGQSLGLGDLVRLGQGERAAGGHRRASIIADALEAVFGAVFLDAGFETGRTVVVHLFADRLAELPDAETLKDAKTRLQEALQAAGRPVPDYAITEISGVQHAQRMSAVCRLADVGHEYIGTGTSRRKAEQAAAEACLRAEFPK